jgi:hypothetical protein
MSESTASPGSGMKLHTKILLGLIVSLSLGIVNLTIGVANPLDHLNLSLRADSRAAMNARRRF